MKSITNILNSQLKKIHLEFGFKHTFIFLLSFAINWYIFKLQTLSLISALITLLYVIIPNKNMKIKPLPKITYIYLNIVLVTFLGCIATTNLFLSLLLNLLVPFIIVCIYTDKTNVNGYLFYYFMFTYMQFLNITLDIFSIYLLSAFIGLIIGYIFQEVIWSNNYKNIDSNIIISKDLFVIKLKSNYLRLKDSLNLDLFIPRFAVRLSIATAFSFVLWKYLNLPKWYWISMSTCFTLVPMCNQIDSRAFFRIRSTIIGSILFLIFSFSTTNLYVLAAFTLLAILLMISYIPYNHISEQYIFATYVTLSFSILSLTSITASTYRISYVLIGSFLAVVFNKLILPNKSKELCER